MFNFINTDSLVILYWAKAPYSFIHSTLIDHESVRNNLWKFISDCKSSSTKTDWSSTGMFCKIIHCFRQLSRAYRINKAANIIISKVWVIRNGIEKPANAEKTLGQFQQLAPPPLPNNSKPPSALVRKPPPPATDTTTDKLPEQSQPKPLPDSKERREKWFSMRHCISKHHLYGRTKDLDMPKLRRPTQIQQDLATYPQSEHPQQSQKLFTSLDLDDPHEYQTIKPGKYLIKPLTILTAFKDYQITDLREQSFLLMDMLD